MPLRRLVLSPASSHLSSQNLNQPPSRALSKPTAPGSRQPLKHPSSNHRSFQSPPKPSSPLSSSRRIPSPPRSTLPSSSRRALSSSLPPSRPTPPQPLLPSSSPPTTPMDPRRLWSVPFCFDLVRSCCTDSLSLVLVRASLSVRRSYRWSRHWLGRRSSPSRWTGNLRLEDFLRSRRSWRIGERWICCSWERT